MFAHNIHLVANEDTEQVGRLSNNSHRVCIYEAMDVQLPGLLIQRATHGCPDVATI